VRRRRLLELGTRLRTEHAYDEVPVAQIAREGRISKALLYAGGGRRHLSDRASALSEHGLTMSNLPP
jgi:hypothetical protein